MRFDVRRQFVPAILPWLTAGAILVVYLLTLNHWVTINSLNHGSLAQASRIAGWKWEPELYGPLQGAGRLSGPVSWLVTYPLHWLPAKHIPLGLNLFSALCAALTLALLARSVALLPHDRTQDQRDRETSPFSMLSNRTAWLPPVLAVLLCGLQLTFWENATSASSADPPWGAGFAMLDVLLFAYVVRCLLEFRVVEKESWLCRGAFVCALGMTNHWGMIGFFPIFLVALVWIKGLSFFNIRFLVRMSLWGLAGLSLYLLLPLVQSLGDISRIPFWQGLKANLAAQKTILFFLPFSKDRLLHGFTGDQPLWVLGLFSLLPLLVMAIRWPTYFGDPSRLGVALTTLIFHTVHAAMLLVCVWVALDPPFSPRHLIPWVPLLSFYYLGALSAGYFSGYFLLVFRPLLAMGRFRASPPWLRPLHLAATAVIALVLVLAPAMLLRRNLPQIRLSNGPTLARYAGLQVAALKQRGSTKGVVVLSDDWRKLALAESAAARSGFSGNCMFVDTAALKWPSYHALMKRKYPQLWPGQPPKQRKELYDDNDALHLVFLLAESNDVFYLHPSFGFFFEVFYPEPHGLVYQLRHRPTDSLFPPPLSKEGVAENENFWTSNAQAIQPLLSALAPFPRRRGGDWLDSLLKRAHLPDEPNRDAALLGTFYSHALNYWGVTAQQHGQLHEAAVHFQHAQELNPGNVVARINLEFNRNLQAGRSTTVQQTQALQDQLEKYRSLQAVLNDNGPFDEPTFCYEQGREFAMGGNYRQGAQWFGRVKALAPENLGARLLLGQIYLLGHMPDEALKLVAEVHAHWERSSQAQTNQIELLSLETGAWLDKGEVTGAVSAVETTLKQHPNDPNLLVAAAQIYMERHIYSNALPLLDRHLTAFPNDVGTLVNKGYACLQIGAYDEALPPLCRVLELETNVFSQPHNSALLNRAIANKNLDNLDAAERDYLTILKHFPTADEIYWPLSEIALRKHATNTAIRYLELYLTNAPPGSALASNIVARLNDLRPGRR